MRTLAVLALVLVACGPADRRDRSAAQDSAAAPTPRGPDLIVLRIARGGGEVRAFVYPQLDSMIWSSAQRTPVVARMLAFNQEAGTLAFVDAGGAPGRIDLRLGTVDIPPKTKLAALASSDGSTIFGIAANGLVTRVTPAATWTFQPAHHPQAVLPQPDGSIIVAMPVDKSLSLVRLFPPELTITDSTTMAHEGRFLFAQAGDRVYASSGEEVIGIAGRDMARTKRINVDGTVRSMVPTPSGDRLYVAKDSSRNVSVIDRYRDDVEREIELPGDVSGLRMDPLGRYLLAQPMRGDSAWVVAIGTDRVVGSVHTAWRPDLPLVSPDGQIVLASGRDVSFVDGNTLQERRRVAGGAADYWYMLLWNGFRPRAAGIDEPVRFTERDSSAAAPPVPDSVATTPPPADTVTRATAPPPDTTHRQTAKPGGFTVSFYALLAEDRARQLAAEIRVDGQTARVITSQTGGTTVYRVVLGPYATKAEAERAGRESKHSYWVYEGIP